MEGKGVREEDEKILIALLAFRSIKKINDNHKNGESAFSDSINPKYKKRGTNIFYNFALQNIFFHFLEISLVCKCQ